MSSLLERSRCHIVLPLTIDVLDYILSFLESDSKTLKACCRSHPLLCQIAEPHIYASIYLRTSNHVSDRNFGPSNLVNLLSNRPHIANYIRNLDIQVSGDSDEEMVPFLHEISTALPKLLTLKKITLDHRSTPTSFCWESQPECFRMVFIGCLRSPSVQHVCLRGIFHFPFVSVWNGESQTIKSLTVGNCFVWDPFNRAPTLDLYDSECSNAPIESLTFECCGGNFLEKFSGWVKTFRMHFRSLEYFQDDNYDLLPSLLSCSSNFLTNLDLDLGRKCMSVICYPLTRGSSHLRPLYLLSVRTFYDFDEPTPIIPDPNNIIPIKLSTLPCLERLTIHSQLEYIFNQETSGRRGFFSPIPAIMHLLPGTTASDTSHLQRVTLDFNFTIISGYHASLVPVFHLWLSFPEVVCSPFVHLLSRVVGSSGTASSAPTCVWLRVNGKATSRTPGALTQIPIPPHITLSSFAACGELMQFVHRRLLVVTPPISIQNASSLVDGPLTMDPSESRFAVLVSRTDLRNVSDCESRKLFTMLWVASIQDNPPMIEIAP